MTQSRVPKHNSPCEYLWVICSTTELMYLARESAVSPMVISGQVEFSTALSARLDFLPRMTAGLRSAARKFPELQRRLKVSRWSARWRPCEGDFFEIRAQRGSRPARVEAFQSFYKDALQKSDRLYLQLYFFDEDEGKYYLGVHMHHVLGDGVSFGRIFDHQIRFAFSENPPQERPEILEVRHHSHPTRKSSFRFEKPCEAIWTSGTKPSGQRKVLLWTQSREKLDRLLKNHPEVRMGDFLAALLMETCSQWNSQHGSPAHRIGIFLTHNNRLDAIKGFGHATTRIRLYRKYPANTYLWEKAKALRQQLLWSRKNGEWEIPTFPWLRFFPFWCFRILINWVSDSPKSDLGTILFTYLPTFSERYLEEEVPGCEKVYGLSTITPRHPLTVSATGTRHSILWSFNYDSGRLNEAEAHEFQQILEEKGRALSEPELRQGET